LTFFALSTMLFFMNRNEKNPDHILVADDNKVIVKLIQELLNRAGYQVTTVNTGKKALEVMPVIQPDLVLLDVDMPGMSGFEVCRIIKQDLLTADIPVLFVTACNDRKDIIAGFDAGGQDYILKPFTKEELLARVQTHLALRQAQQELQASVIRYRKLSVIDDLTGLFNTRYLYQTLQAQLDTHPRQPLSVIFIDIDNFKQVVDTHGHLNASNTIAELAEVIISLLPEECYGVSYGGDEFVVVLANHTREQGFQIARQIRLAIEKAQFLTFCDLAIKITVSCGVATFPDDAQTLTTLLDNADLALFESKRRGRNAVVSFSEHLTSS
jgi:diguanylate cyclase (GGDEF)-like protein